MKASLMYISLVLHYKIWWVGRRKVLVEANLLNMHNTKHKTKTIHSNILTYEVLILFLRQEVVVTVREPITVKVSFLVIADASAVRSWLKSELSKGCSLVHAYLRVRLLVHSGISQLTGIGFHSVIEPLQN